MTKRTLSRTALLATTLALSLSARPALAQSAAERAAQKAFDEGMKLLDQGKAAEACPKLEESQRLDPAMGTQFRLAECWEKTGRTASAWSLFRQVASEAQAAGRDDRASVSVKRAAALEARLTRILIIVAPSARVPGLIVRRDGAVVEEALWGSGVAVDPGEHLISATAPGKKTWELQQQARSGTVMVTIPTLVPSAGETIVAVPKPPPIEVPAEPAGPHRSLVPGLVLSGVAVAGLGTGIALVVAANGAKANSAKIRSEIQNVDHTDCVIPSGSCDELASRAQSAGTLSNAAFWTLIGSGAAAGGALAYFLWPTAKPAETSGAVVHVLPTVGLGGVGFSAAGTF